MLKSSFPFAVAAGAAMTAATGVVALPASAGTTGGCVAGKPSVLVHVAGFRRATGKVKVSVYGSESRWLAKGGRIGRVKMPVTSKSMDICMPVPAPGRYAVVVHHDYNVNGERDRQDGGGYSRNPKVSLLNPKPPFSKAAFTVGNGPSKVGVTLLYVRGLSVGPVGS
jgi:uncharacterized protein (DUF2141 family)